MSEQMQLALRIPAHGSGAVSEVTPPVLLDGANGATVYMALVDVVSATAFVLEATLQLSLDRANFFPFGDLLALDAPGEIEKTFTGLGAVWSRVLLTLALEDPEEAAVANVAVRLDPARDDAAPPAAPPIPLFGRVAVDAGVAAYGWPKLDPQASLRELADVVAGRAGGTNAPA